MEKQKMNKGITLVALIITIIILLILAVVTIGSVNGNGIIAHAKKAKQDYEDKAKKEEELLKYYEGILETQEVVPTTDQLQEKYQFDYYSTLSKAIDDVNNETTENKDATKENAVAGIYKDENNIVSVVLLKNAEEAKQLTISKDVILNLGGKTLKLTSNDAWILLKSPNMVTIDGRIGGSKIEKNITEETATTVRFIGAGANAANATISILGGEYYHKFNETDSTMMVSTLNFNAANILNIKNCKLHVENIGTCNYIYAMQLRNIIVEGK